MEADELVMHLVNYLRLNLDYGDFLSYMDNMGFNPDELADDIETVLDEFNQ